MRRYNTKRIILFASFIFAATFIFSFLAAANIATTEAANLSKFNPGNIISDYVMSNYNSMTESEIQTFLTSKNPCSNRDYNYYLTLSKKNYTWHWKDNHFICLSEELFGDGETIGSGDTAAHIIWQAAQDYKINPQVLIVLLQKEQGLITDPIPNNRNYRSATGYGCPDTAPCNSEYYGFKNQVRKAAALFRTVLNGGWTNYPLGANYIQYNPDAGCGGSIVNIENLATSSLYRYTPYQPNAAALAAGTGSVYCGAYGNRNFYIYFSDWFGDPTGIMQGMGRTLPDGTYQITPKDHPELSLDIQGRITPETTFGYVDTYAARSYKTDDVTNQVFNVNYNESIGYYRIINPTTNTLLGVESGTNKLIVSEPNGSCFQNWNISRAKDGYYVFFSSCAGDTMDLNQEGNIVLGNNNNLWKIREVSDNTRALADGAYKIASGFSRDYVFDGDTGDLILKERKIFNDRSQLFDIKYDEDTGWYSIINQASGLSLDLCGDNSANETKITLWTYHGASNQQWMIRQDQDGYYHIFSISSGKALDIYGGELQSNRNIVIWPEKASKDEQWEFIPVNNNNEEHLDGEYKFYSKLSGNPVIDISGGVYQNMGSGQAIIYTDNGTYASNQIFNIKYDEQKNCYYISNSTANLFLDVYGGDTADGTDVIFWPFHGGENQQWQIQKDEEDGGYIIMSVSSGKAIDVYGGSNNIANKIIIWDKHGADNQKWFLQKVQ